MPYQKLPSPNPPGRPGKLTALVNPALKALRAEAVLKARAQGVPMKQLAIQYKCSENTLYSLLKWAKNEGLLRELRDRVVEELAPVAINAYKAALDADVNELTPNQVKAHKMKLTAAKDVNAGIGIFQKHSESKTTKEEFSLAAYYERREKRIGDGEQTSSESEVTEAQLLDSAEVTTEEVPPSDVQIDDLGGLPEWLDEGDGGEPAQSDSLGEERE